MCVSYYLLFLLSACLQGKALQPLTLLFDCSLSHSTFLFLYLKIGIVPVASYSSTLHLCWFSSFMSKFWKLHDLLREIRWHIIVIVDKIWKPDHRNALQKVIIALLFKNFPVLIGNKDAVFIKAFFWNISYQFHTIICLTLILILSYYLHRAVPSIVTP